MTEPKPKISSHYFPDPKGYRTSFIGLTFIGTPRDHVTLACGREFSEDAIKEFLEKNLLLHAIHPKLTYPDALLRETFLAEKV